MSLAFAFDFDGVVIDSLTSLKSTYFKFLRGFGVEGSAEEFNSLNGPSIAEIVLILQERYQLEPSCEALLDQYKILLRESYLEAPLVDGAFDCLRSLFERGIFLSLVTSSSRDLVEKLLKKHKIHDFFGRIVTGDEVTKSKPSPEIYSIVKKEFPNYSFWAVEDSNNGLRSAIGAGLNVIYFDPDSIGTDVSVDCRINALEKLKSFVAALELDYCIVERSASIRIHVETDYVPEITDSENKKVNEVWEKAQATKPLQDGSVLYYLGHSTREDICLIKGFWSSYKYFYSMLCDDSIELPFVPLAVSGICLSEEDLFLVARRRNVTEYNASAELAPSGGIGADHQDCEEVLFREQLKQELVEETPVVREAITSMTDLGLVKDRRHGVIDVCCLLEVEESSSNLVDSLEYSGLSWLKKSELPTANMVPTSKGLIELFEALGFQE